jgi:hypothetical protein
VTKLPKELRPSIVDMAGLWRVRPYFERIKETIMADLVTQPTALPSRKVTAAATGGVTAMALIWAAKQFLGWELGTVEAEAIVAALAVIAGYFVRERAPAALR